MPGGKRRPAALLALGLLLAGCGDADPLDGTWTGAFRDGVALLGGGHLSFAQSGSSLTGTWEVTFGASSPFNDRGTVSGTVEANVIAVILTSARGRCPLALAATRDGDRITGSYMAASCSYAQSGTVDLERR